MKRILIITLLSFHCLFGNAQINLENTYSNVADDRVNEKFELKAIDLLLYKYMHLDYNQQSITLFNLDHSIYRTFSIPSIVTSTPTSYRVRYVSRTLFDCDSTNIEYAVEFIGNGLNPVMILREDSTVLFVDSNHTFRNRIVNGEDEQHESIITTPQGTKMILHNNFTREVVIYSLCGITPFFSTKENDLYSKLTAYPNPTRSRVTIEYDLEGEGQGTLTIFDSQGRKFKEYKVGNQFKNLIIDTSGWKSGTYLYNVSTKKGVSQGKKIIKVD